MIYLVIYTSGRSENAELSYIEAEDLQAAREKVEALFKELKEVKWRKHTLLDVTPLDDIRKLDS